MADLSGNRVNTAFEAMRRDGRRGLMPFICGGYPRPGVTAELIPTIAEAGATAIEIGLPFSDPIADGPVIAEAMHEALVAGSTVTSVLEEIRQARAATEVPLIAMVSMSIVWACGGPEGFTKRCADSGVDGLIVPDAPLEESAQLAAAVAEAGLTLSLLVAPTTPPQRLKRITDLCSGFVYVVARTGVTGERDAAPDIAGQITKLRACTELPLACGFGISSAEHVAAVVEHADAAIVGTALVRKLGEASRSGDDPRSVAATFVASLAEGLPAPAPAASDGEAGQP